MAEGKKARVKMQRRRGRWYGFVVVACGVFGIWRLMMMGREVFGRVSDTS
jgi:nitrate reductase NapE component